MVQKWQKHSIRGLHGGEVNYTCLVVISKLLGGLIRASIVGTVQTKSTIGVHIARPRCRNAFFLVDTAEYFKFW